MRWVSALITWGIPLIFSNKPSEWIQTQHSQINLKDHKVLWKVIRIQAFLVSFLYCKRVSVQGIVDGSKNTTAAWKKTLDTKRHSRPNFCCWVLFPNISAEKTGQLLKDVDKTTGLFCFAKYFYLKFFKNKNKQKFFFFYKTDQCRNMKLWKDCK